MTNIKRLSRCPLSFFITKSISWKNSPYMISLTTLEEPFSFAVRERNKSLINGTLLCSFCGIFHLCVECWHQALSSFSSIHQPLCFFSLSAPFALCPWRFASGHRANFLDNTIIHISRLDTVAFTTSTTFAPRCHHAGSASAHHNNIRGCLILLRDHLISVKGIDPFPLFLHYFFNPTNLTTF